MDIKNPARRLEEICLPLPKKGDDRELNAEQAGFMKGRGTGDQITNIRHLMEMCFEFRGKIFMFH